MTAPILKDINAVMKDAVERYHKEFIWQDVKLSDTFKEEFSRCLAEKKGRAVYHEFTTVIITRNNQYLFIDNEWFAIASYFVDFCTELFTYRQYFMRICDHLIKDPLSYAEKLRSLTTEQDKSTFLSAAEHLLESDFPDRTDIDVAATYLWKFVSDYAWWGGSKTVNRHDFFYSAVLNNLNVVNNSSSYLGDIIQFYAEDYSLRKLVDSVELFTVGIRTRSYMRNVSEKEVEIIVEHPAQETSAGRTLSISAASLERFMSNKI